MRVTCKITGEDKTSWLLNKWEEERKAKELQKKIAKEFHLFDEWMEGLVKKNGITRY